MKDLFVFGIFLLSLNYLNVVDSLYPTILFSFSVAYFVIKYLRMKNKIENFQTIQKAKLAKLKEIFLQTVMHDFKIPILAQLRGVELLKNGVLGNVNETQAEILIQIEKSCKDVLDMISMYTAFHTIESKNLDYEKFNIKELLSDCFAELSDLAKEKNVILSCSSELPDTGVEADKNDIKKVLLNMLSNAINYSRYGGSVNVKMETNRNLIKLRFFGMKLLKHRNSEYSTVGHTVGMYLCKKIIELHNGKLFFCENNSDEISFVIPRIRNTNSIAKMLQS